MKWKKRTPKNPYFAEYREVQAAWLEESKLNVRMSRHHGCRQLKV